MVIIRDSIFALWVAGVTVSNADLTNFTAFVFICAAVTCVVWFDIILPTSQAYAYPNERILPFSYWNVWFSSSKFCLFRSIFCCSVGHCPVNSGINRTRDEQPVHINLSRFTSMLVVIPISFSPLPYSAHCQSRATETTNVSSLLLAQFVHTTINALFKVTRARTGYSAVQELFLSLISMLNNNNNNNKSCSFPIMFTFLSHYRQWAHQSARYQ